MPACRPAGDERERLAGVFLLVCALQVGFVASFCSKLSDTVSSEVGKAYGQTTYLVTTFQRVPRGTEGAVSLEGTAAGVAAAFLFAGVAVATGQVGARAHNRCALAVYGGRGACTHARALPQ